MRDPAGIPDQRRGAAAREEPPALHRRALGLLGQHHGVGAVQRGRPRRRLQVHDRHGLAQGDGGVSQVDRPAPAHGHDQLHLEPERGGVQAAGDRFHAVARLHAGHPRLVRADLLPVHAVPASRTSSASSAAIRRTASTRRTRTAASCTPASGRSSCCRTPETR